MGSLRWGKELKSAFTVPEQKPASWVVAVFYFCILIDTQRVLENIDSKLTHLESVVCSCINPPSHLVN